MLDYYVLHRQFDDLLACVERLDKELGGDPHLDFTRAFVYLQKGDLAAAKKCAQNAAVAEPESPDAGNLLKLISQAERNLQSGQSSGNSKAAETSPGEPAGDAEARAFAETFEKTVRTGDTAAIQAAVDIPAFNRRAMAKVTVPEEIRVGIEMAFSAGGDTGIARIFIGVHSQVERGADFRLLHVHRDNGEQRALFRLVHANDTVAYFDCILVRHADGKVRVDDVYLFEAGMWSEFLGRVTALATESIAKSPQAPAADPMNDGARLIAAVVEMTKRIDAGKYQEALDIYNGLPDRLQKEKVLLVTRIRAARGLKGEPYDEAVRVYRKAFPNEPNLDLILIDAYSAHKLYDRALAAIDGLDRTLGGDPYLDAVRGITYLGKGDLAAAKRCAQKSVAAEPDLPAAYLCRLAIALKEKDFARTSTLLTMIRDKFPKWMPALKSDPDFAEYVKSPQYRSWLAAKKP